MSEIRASFYTMLILYEIKYVQMKMYVIKIFLNNTRQVSLVLVVVSNHRTLITWSGMRPQRSLVWAACLHYSVARGHSIVGSDLYPQYPLCSLFPRTLCVY